MSDVFVSYSQPDRDCAHEMVAHLEAHGVSCWIAPRNISPAADWAAEIIDAISATRVMVLVFSAASNQSAQVRREVERAAHKQVSILPFRIEEVMPSKSLEYFLSAQHWMDAFQPPRDEHYRRLVIYLKSRLGAADSIPAAPGAGIPRLGALELSHVEALLAGYIGPLAKHLVKRAAVRARGLEDLIAGLATELPAESDRSAFAQAAKRIPRA